MGQLDVIVLLNDYAADRLLDLDKNQTNNSGFRSLSRLLSANQKRVPPVSSAGLGRSHVFGAALKASLRCSVGDEVICPKLTDCTCNFIVL